MDKQSKGVLIAAALGILLALGAMPLNGHSWICPTEDSSYCIWFGGIQGNGTGSIVINGADD